MELSSSVYLRRTSCSRSKGDVGSLELYYGDQVTPICSFLPVARYMGGAHMFLPRPGLLEDRQNGPEHAKGIQVQ